EITGFGADLIIVDDLMKTADANSEAEIRNVQEFYDTSLVSRLNNQITGKIIVIQQRLGENDLVGYLKEKGNFEVLSLPSIAQCAEDIQLYGRKTHRRRIGDLLFPQRQPEGVLEKLRREIGNAAFAAHYLQNPTPPGGNRVRWEWFGSYSFEPLRSMFHYVIQSWDTGQSDLPTSSFSVCMTWGWRDGKWYLIDLARGQWRYGELKSRALELQGHWKPDIILVEKTANGHALISDLRVLHELRAVVRAVVPRLDKSLRLEAATAELETGKFLIPAEAVWLQNLKRDCMAFPNGSHDDQVDCLSQFVEWQKLRQELINTPMGTNGRRQTRRRRMRPQPCPWICRGALEQANADILNSQLLLSKLLHSVRDHGRCP
ncbi:MAG: phage terminase large subunit, partial [Aestuariivirga sp.]